MPKKKKDNPPVKTAQNKEELGKRFETMCASGCDWERGGLSAFFSAFYTEQIHTRVYIYIYISFQTKKRKEVHIF